MITSKIKKLLITISSTLAIALTLALPMSTDVIAKTKTPKYTKEELTPIFDICLHSRKPHYAFGLDQNPLTEFFITASYCMDDINPYYEYETQDDELYFMDPDLAQELITETIGYIDLKTIHGYSFTSINPGKITMYNREGDIRDYPAVITDITYLNDNKIAIIGYQECRVAGGSLWHGEFEITLHENENSGWNGLTFHSIKCLDEWVKIIENSDEYEYDTDLLSYNHSAQELELAKYEIYANHGCRFSSGRIQQYFNKMSWYKGTIDYDSFSQADLNKIEINNLRNIEKAQKDVSKNNPTSFWDSLADAHIYINTTHPQKENELNKWINDHIIPANFNGDITEKFDELKFIDLDNNGYCDKIMVENKKGNLNIKIVYNNGSRDPSIETTIYEGDSASPVAITLDHFTYSEYESPENLLVIHALENNTPKVIAAINFDNLWSTNFMNYEKTPLSNFFINEEGEIEHTER